MPALPAGLAPLRTVPSAGLIAERLRAAVLDGGFRPGQQLAETAIAERLGVSRGPVREAMARLVQEGLLVAVRNRGVFVVELGAADVRDVYQARRALERHAADALRRSRDPERLAALEELVEAMRAAAAAPDPDRVGATDLVFHECLVAGAGSPRLSRMFGTLVAETRICVIQLTSGYPDLNDVVAEHRVLLDALRTGTRRQVMAAVDEHLDSAVRQLAGHLAERTGPASAKPDADS